mmetsp:Transcript_24224/g.77765  ORF Transcript_24224/g.77765 Transcript_24224/m.77765 type:complete len:151 (-) Transcript_24224:219-671(-)
MTGMDPIAPASVSESSQSSPVAFSISTITNCFLGADADNNLASMLGGPPSSLDYGGLHVAHAASSFASTVIPSAALPFAMACSPHHCHRPPPVTSALPTSMAPQLHDAVSTGDYVSAASLVDAVFAPAVYAAGPGISWGGGDHDGRRHYL